MSDQLLSQSPLPEGEVRHSGVTIVSAPDLGRFSMRARDAALLSGIVGLPLPEHIGHELDGVIRLGPDEYYAVLERGRALPLGEDQAVSVVEVSARAVGIVVEGPRAAETIMAGCPLDLERFSVGRATRTVFETVEIVLRRVGEERFHIDVWRSFAPWLWQALNEAAHG